MSDPRSHKVNPCDRLLLAMWTNHAHWRVAKLKLLINYHNCWKKNQNIKLNDKENKDFNSLTLLCGLNRLRVLLIAWLIRHRKLWILIHVGIPSQVLLNMMR